jgi:hypothetical protein
LHLEQNFSPIKYLFSFSLKAFRKQPERKIDDKSRKEVFLFGSKSFDIHLYSNIEWKGKG